MRKRWIRGQGYVDAPSDATRAPAPATPSSDLGGIGDILNKGDFEALMKSLGISGDNPARPLDRRSQVLQAIRAIMQGQYANQLEPLRQSTTNQFLMNLNPANIQARIDAVSRANRSQAARNFEQAGATMTGVSPASLASFFANADRQTAQYGQAARSPQGISGAYQGMLGAIDAASNPGLAQLVSQLQGNMQQSNMTKDAPKNTFGSALGSIGQILGMGGFGGGGNNGLYQASQKALGGW